MFPESGTAGSFMAMSAMPSSVVSCRSRLSERYTFPFTTSVTRNDSSVSISGVSATRPEPETARRDDATSSFTVMRSLVTPSSAVISPTPSSPAKRSRTVPRTV